jgi:hypothetical protein
MTDRPILFSPEMVRALLDGRKTQTRRIFKPQPVVHDAGDCAINGHRGSLDYLMREIAPRFWARFAVGDGLWVREAWRTAAAYDDISPSAMGGEEPIIYEVDGSINTHGWRQPREIGRNRSSIHMPRWASRLTLTVTDVRVQRLHDIGLEDAIAEGVDGCLASDFAETDRLGELEVWADWLARDAYLYPHPNPEADSINELTDDPRLAYRWLWESINGAGSWEKNPWVVALTFTVEKAA